MILASQIMAQVKLIRNLTDQIISLKGNIVWSEKLRKIAEEEYDNRLKEYYNYTANMIVEYWDYEVSYETARSKVAEIVELISENGILELINDK